MRQNGRLTKPSGKKGRIKTYETKKIVKTTEKEGKIQIYIRDKEAIQVEGKSRYTRKRK